MTIEISYRQYMTTAMTMGLTRSAPGVMRAEKITIPSTAMRRELRSRLEVTMPTFDSRTRTIGNSITTPKARKRMVRSEEHTSELQSRQYLVCRLLLEK